MKTILFDMQLYKKDFLEPKFSASTDEDLKFDVMISNPPWLVAKPLDIFVDSGNYDSNGKVLKNTISYVANNLRKDKGIFYLIYSDLSQVLGTQETKKVEQLVKEEGMVVFGVYRFEGVVNLNKIKSRFDGVKQKAATVIYEIGY
jgi:methylase of polypeptide subunit release factors